MRKQSLFLILAALTATAMGQQADSPIIRTQTTLITVPTLVVQKDGSPLFGLRADEFVIVDNGVLQSVKLDETPDLQPVSLAVVVQTGRGGLSRLQSESCRPDPFGPYSARVKTHCVNGLHAMAVELEPFLRAPGSEMAVLSFDQRVTLQQEFTSDFAKANAALERLHDGGGESVILDAIQTSLHLLDKRPDHHQRRIIILVCEKRDHGSTISFDEVSRRIADSNTEIYVLSFSEDAHEAADLLRAGVGMLTGGMGRMGMMGGGGPGGGAGGMSAGMSGGGMMGGMGGMGGMMGGMGGGMMGGGISGGGVGGMMGGGGGGEMMSGGSGEGGGGHPPSRGLFGPGGMQWGNLVNSYLHVASEEMKTDVPQGLADLNGGEYIMFNSLRSFDDALAMLGNHAHNRYQLSFRPVNPTPGAHKIYVGMHKNLVGVMIAARTGYYLKGDATGHMTETATSTTPISNSAAEAAPTPSVDQK